MEKWIAAACFVGAMVLLVVETFHPSPPPDTLMWANILMLYFLVLGKEEKK